MHELEKLFLNSTIEMQIPWLDGKNKVKTFELGDMIYYAPIHLEKKMKIRRQTQSFITTRFANSRELNRNGYIG
jgi:hypothetical protein